MQTQSFQARIKNKTMYHFILLVSLSKVVVHLMLCALFKGFLISTTKLNFKYPILFSSLTFFFFFPSYIF